MASAIDVANVFLAAAPKDDSLTNLKLQKLCAYGQAVSLAYKGSPIFQEDMEAWTHGPVIPSVYERFKDNEASPIKPLMTWEDAAAKFDEGVKYILQMTWATYGRFTAWALRDQSHWDFPGKFGSKAIIPKDKIQQAFSNNLLVQRLRRSDALTEAQYALDI